MRKLSKKLSLKQVFRQKGVALILMAVILALAASAYAIKIFNISSIQARQDADAFTVLANAKATLLGYTFGRVGGGERPGNMPVPDRLLSPTEAPPAGGPPNYDGQTDSCTGSGAGMSCLGRLPWQTIGMPISNPTQNDQLGTMPWYAVSANLVDTICFTALNPSILNATTCTGGTPLHPWLTVRDSKGNVISNRVAIVLILPGKPIGNQTRSSSPLGDVTNYLDGVVITVGCIAPCVPGNYSNADLDNDFIMASGLTSTNSDQNDQNLTSTINDKILFITIDEFMAELTKRAAVEARLVLSGYKSSNGLFPYAAPLGASGSNFIFSATSTTGMLPIDGTDKCTCTSSTNCTCGYTLVNSVAHTRTSGGNYTIKSGFCVISSRKCTCTGDGLCQNASASRKFTCLSGNCSFSGTGTSQLFTYTPRSTHGNIASASTGCSLVSGNATCNAAGDFYVGLNVPSWFKTNLWQDYFYYHQSSSSVLQLGQPHKVGYHTSISALIIGVGATLSTLTTPTVYAYKGAAQLRPSASEDDYLDSAINVNGKSNNLYDAIGTLRTSNYNDQMFIVAP